MDEVWELLVVMWMKVLSEVLQRNSYSFLQRNLIKNKIKTKQVWYNERNNNDNDGDNDDDNDDNNTLKIPKLRKIEEDSTRLESSYTTKQPS